MRGADSGRCDQFGGTTEGSALDHDCGDTFGPPAGLRRGGGHCGGLGDALALLLGRVHRRQACVPAGQRCRFQKPLLLHLAVPDPPRAAAEPGHGTGQPKRPVNPFPARVSTDAGRPVPRRCGQIMPVLLPGWVRPRRRHPRHGRRRSSPRSRPGPGHGADAVP